MKNTLTVYHNPRCRKSREAINYLNQLNIDYNIVLYLTNPLNEVSLKNLLSNLKIKAIDLVRKNELLWKPKFFSYIYPLNNTDDDYLDNL